MVIYIHINQIGIVKDTNLNGKSEEQKMTVEERNLSVAIKESNWNDNCKEPNLLGNSDEQFDW
jgi:hypothetical protein